MYRNLIRKNSSFLIATGIYIISVILIAPWGNFSVSDDFYYLLQVRAFSLGVISKSALIGPTLVLQSFIALLWTSLFGHTYISARILTIIFSILCVYVVSKILKLLDVKDNLITLCLLLVYFNQQFYPLSLTFMSENYFLFFVFSSVYFFFLFTKHKNIRQLLLASILGGLSVMIRQYGVVLLFTYLIVYVFSFSKKPTKKEIIALVIPFITLSLIGIFWPRFKAISEPKSMDLSLFFTSFRSFTSRIFDVEILPYVGFILLPFSSELFVKTKNMAKVVLVILSLPLSYVFYQDNIFNLGNLFYLESLYARHAINIRKHLFNNIPFKISLSYILALSVLVLAYILFRSIYNAYRSKSIRLSALKKNPILLSFILIISGFYFIVMLTDRVFDRYLMNFFLFLTLLTTFLYSKYKHKISLLFYVTLTLTSVMTFLLTMDYYRQNQLKWELADKVTNLKGIDRGEVFVDQEYAYTVFMEESDNYRGLEKVSYGGYVRTCFVQEYSKSVDNKLNNLIGNIENRSVIHKYFPNIYIDKAGLMKSESNEFDSEDVLYFEQEYISPIYNLLGKRLFVRAFCLN